MTSESKLYRRGTARAGQPLFGTDHYLALADCNKSIRRCDRNCDWPHCSRELHYFNKKASADAKEEELKSLGHRVEDETQ